MEKMTFREAQLLVLGADVTQHPDKVVLNNLQTFHIGDDIEVVEISLLIPAIVVRFGELESYIPIKNLAEWVVDECITILREVADYYDEEFQKKRESL